MRLFFATDIHGSETCWRKFLNSGEHYKADVVILGGDMTGKALVPIVDDGGGRWHATLLENRNELEGEDAVREFEEAVQRRGYYPFRTTPEDLAALSASEEKWHALFDQHMIGTVERWMQMADERLAGKGIGVFVCPGHDDQLEIDEVGEAANTVELGEGRVVEIDGFQLASSGWANRTPWDTYREEDEDALLERFERMISDVTTDPEHTIFSLHCPPYNTGLDEAPQLTADMSLKDEGRATVPVGSTAGRQVIERYQPALALHGHIHEARGTHRLGKTLCINPGSSYEQGQLLRAPGPVDAQEKEEEKLLVAS